MKHYHLSATMKLCLLAVASSTLLFTSCAQDGFDDETFVGTYSGYPLGNPDPEAITVKASSDKLSQTITWPAVNGAGTYTVTVYMGENYENLVIDKQVVKVNYITIPRIDKTFYRISILVNDNIPEGNTGSTAPTDYDWDTFTINVATIPTGENLNSWFKANPTPVSYMGSDITYTLEAGGQYTLTDSLNFSGYILTIAGADEANRPTITIATADKEDGTSSVGCIATSCALSLKNLKIDCAALPYSSTNAPIAMSKNPDPSIKGKVGTQTTYYNITDGGIYISNCDIDNVNGMLFFDNSITYCIETFTLENSRVHFTTTAGNKANVAYIYTPGGFIKDLIIRNSTLYNTGEGYLQYVIRYNNSGRLDRAGYVRSNGETLNDLDNITFNNSTFYNIGYGWFANWAAFAGQPDTAFDIQNNIFCEAGFGGSGVARRLCAGRPATSYVWKCIFSNNTYWTKGAAEKEGAPEEDPENPHQYDTSHSALQTDPAFRDPANGDLTPTGSEQVAKKTGDPYWFK